jgi:hypothetical protein
MDSLFVSGNGAAKAATAATCNFLWRPPLAQYDVSVMSLIATDHPIVSPPETKRRPERRSISGPKQKYLFSTVHANNAAAMATETLSKSALSLRWERRISN